MVNTRWFVVVAIIGVFFVSAEATRVEATTLFAADFQGTAVDQGNQVGTSVTETNLENGTQTGGWTLADDGVSRMVSDGADRGALFEKTGMNITADFDAAGALATGVTISYDTAVRRTAKDPDPPRTPMIKGLASDDTVLFVLGLQGDGDVGDSGYLRLVYFDADFTGDVDGANNPGINYVGTAGAIAKQDSSYDAGDMSQIKLELSATSFDILIDGTLALNGDDVPYLNAATDINRLNFQADYDGGAWYDNFNVDLAVVETVAGDVNGNGIVNAVDLDLFEGQFGGAPDPNFSADFDGNGIVDLDDFAILRGNWGFGVVPTAPEAAPEPATMSLLALGGLAVLRRRRRHRSCRRS